MSLGHFRGFPFLLDMSLSPGCPPRSRAGHQIARGSGAAPLAGRPSYGFRKGWERKRVARKRLTDFQVQLTGPNLRDVPWQGSEPGLLALRVRGA